MDMKEIWTLGLDLFINKGRAGVMAYSKKYKNILLRTYTKCITQEHIVVVPPPGKIIKNFLVVAWHWQVCYIPWYVSAV